MAGSTNFQQWNPEAANQETDSEYTADSARSGGVVDGEVFNAETANKLFFQSTTFPAAFARSMANKGFTVSDADFNQLVTVLSNVLTTADQKAALQSVSFGASLTFDCSKANGFQITLGGNVTSSTVVGASPGQIVTFVLIQDGTGGHTFAWPTSITGTSPIDGTANITNVQQFIARADGTLRPINALAAN
jgi:hypothetical protein